MDAENCEFTNVDTSSMLESSEVTKHLENKVENGCFKNYGNDLDPENISAKTNLNPPCDMNFPKTNDVIDCKEYKYCDNVDNNTLPPVRQESVDLSEIRVKEQNTKVNDSRGTHEASDMPPNIEMIDINKSQSTNCTSLAMDKPKNTVRSTDASLQEVLDKVNELDIVDNPEILVKIPAVVLKHQTDSLRNLLMYHSESSDMDDEEFEANWQLQAFQQSSSTESDSEVEECVEISEDDNSGLVLPNNKKIPQKKNFKEDDQPMEPVADLSNIKIDYVHEEFLHIGQIANFINSTVTIDALENSDSYNLETVLFVDDKTSKRPLGAITDVIGPVNQPIYCVQLRSPEDIETLGLKKGMKVYSAPKTVYTKYVFLKDLLRMKGTDASWEGDEEPPTDVESSEEEFDAEGPASRKRSHNNSLERHKKFESQKNRCNTIKNKVANLFDKYRPRAKSQKIHVFPHGFDPNVPPPNMQPNMQGYARVAPQPPPPLQPNFGEQRHMRHNSRFQGNLLPRFSAPTDNVFNNGFYHNRPGPSHQNFY